MDLVKFMADALDAGEGQFFGFQFKRKFMLLIVVVSVLCFWTTLYSNVIFHLMLFTCKSLHNFAQPKSSATRRGPSRHFIRNEAPILPRRRWKMMVSYVSFDGWPKILYSGWIRSSLRNFPIGKAAVRYSLSLLLSSLLPFPTLYHFSKHQSQYMGLLHRRLWLR